MVSSSLTATSITQRHRPSNINDVLLGLNRCKQISATKWTADCPCTGHKTPGGHLAIDDAGVKAIVKCFNTHSYEDICRALGFDSLTYTRSNCQHASVQPAYHLAEQYHYEIEKGTDQYIIERWVSDTRGKDGKTLKRFTVKRSVNGKIEYGLGGLRPILYHLPEVQSWKRAGQSIRWPEGERKADKFIEMGLPATTLPFGAGQAINYDEINELAGADILIYPDNDEPGEKHAQDKASKLVGRAKSIKVVRLPDLPAKGDIIDWIAQGHTREELLEIESNTPYYQPDQNKSEVINRPEESFYTDLSNAERLINRHGINLRYCFNRKKWLQWTGKMWEWVEDGRIISLASETVRHMYLEAYKESQDSTRKKLIDHAVKSESEQRLRAMVILAQSIPGVCIETKELDSSPWLFNCNNGTINLKTGLLQDHKREDYITKISRVDYEPTASTTVWCTFLSKVLGGNESLIKYLQKCIGYSLTGNTSEQVLFFLYGTGGNGKSTFINIVRKLEGDYGLQARSELFLLTERDNRSSGESLANLEGMRFVAATELEEGKHLSVAQIKAMTGGEPIRADRKYEHEYQFEVLFKLWFSGNHKPKISDTTRSIWRRVKLIPFTVPISDEERDSELSEKLESELSGILAWAVQGCLSWQREGLEEPDEVKVATSNYKEEEEEDVIADFLADRCMFEPCAMVIKG